MRTCYATDDNHANWLNQFLTPEQGRHFRAQARRYCHKRNPKETREVWREIRKREQRDPVGAVVIPFRQRVVVSIREWVRKKAS